MGDRRPSSGRGRPEDLRDLASKLRDLWFGPCHGASPLVLRLDSVRADVPELDSARDLFRGSPNPPRWFFILPRVQTGFPQDDQVAETGSYGGPSVVVVAHAERLRNGGLDFLLTGTGSAHRLLILATEVEARSHALSRAKEEIVERRLPPGAWAEGFRQAVRDRCGTAVERRLRAEWLEAVEAIGLAHAVPPGALLSKLEGRRVLRIDGGGPPFELRALRSFGHNLRADRVLAALNREVEDLSGALRDDVLPLLRVLALAGGAAPESLLLEAAEAEGNAFDTLGRLLERDVLRTTSKGTIECTDDRLAGALLSAWRHGPNRAHTARRVAVAGRQRLPLEITACLDLTAASIDPKAPISAWQVGRAAVERAFASRRYASALELALQLLNALSAPDGSSSALSDAEPGRIVRAVRRFADARQGAGRGARLSAASDVLLLAIDAAQVLGERWELVERLSEARCQLEAEAEKGTGGPERLAQFLNRAGICHRVRAYAPEADDVAAARAESLHEQALLVLSGSRPTLSVIVQRASAINNLASVSSDRADRTASNSAAAYAVFQANALAIEQKSIESLLTADGDPAVRRLALIPAYNDLAWTHAKAAEHAPTLDIFVEHAQAAINAYAEARHRARQSASIEAERFLRQTLENRASTRERLRKTWQRRSPEPDASPPLFLEAQETSKDHHALTALAARAREEQLATIDAATLVWRVDAGPDPDL